MELKTKKKIDINKYIDTVVKDFRMGLTEKEIRFMLKHVDMVPDKFVDEIIPKAYLIIKNG